MYIQFVVGSYSKVYLLYFELIMSVPKEDMSGAVFIMKAESLEKAENYLSNEPFKIYGIQDYKVIEF